MMRRLISVSVLIAVLLSFVPVSPSASESHRNSAQSGNVDQRSWLAGLQSYAALGNWLLSKLPSRAKREREMTAAPPVTAFLTLPMFLNAPTNLTMTSASDTQLVLSWTAPVGSVDHYQVERSQSVSGPFLFLANAAVTSFSDATVATDHAYLYRVRAVTSGGAPSLPSNMAMGTATTFEFTNLIGQEVRAQHFYDVRTTVNAVRAVAGMAPASWARGTLTGLEVKADDVNELRTALDAALSLLNIPITAYDDATLSVGMTLIKATHIEQLQIRSTRGSSTSAGPLDADASTARLDPMNETGGGGENALSRNFNWNLPLVSLPGRAGMDLGLSLSYNSLVWTLAGSAISFDSDHGFPSPGFRLGFPVIQPLYYNSEVGTYAFLLIGPDGSRTELRQVGVSTLYEAADSSHLLLDANTMTLRTTDGTQLTYALLGAEYNCTQIKDRNGNYITVNYTVAGRIDTVVDTLARSIKFNYDAGGSLTSITQVWNQGAANQVTHSWATFTYVNTTIQTNLPGLSVYGPANNSTVKTLASVTLADGSHSDFSYSTWGQVWKINGYAPDNHLLGYRSYNLPQTATTAQTDCPRFTERHDWAQYWNGDTDGTAATNEEAVTAFAVPVGDSWNMPDAAGTPQSGMRAQVTAPDGTFNKIYFIGTAGAASGWQRGLPALVNTYDSANASVPQRQAMTTWTQDNTGVSYPLNPRVTETNIYDPAGNRARTETTYQQFTFTNGTSCYLPIDVYEYAANGTAKLRSTRTDYNTSATYTDRRILGLVSEKRLYEGDVNTGGVLLSKVGFLYDESGSIQGSDAPVQHDNTNYSAAFVTGRSNLSTVKRYDVTNVAQFTTNTTKYNTAGAVVLSKDGLDHPVTVSYADAFADGVSRNTLAYQTKVTDPDNYYSTTQYNFDFGAVTKTKSPPPNVTGPQNPLDGPEQTVTFDAIGRLQQTTNLVNGAYTRYEYPTSGNRIDTFMTVQDGLGEAHSFQITDGAGRVIGTAVDHPGSPSNGFSGQRTIYDVMGRVIKTSNPAETAASGAPMQWTTVGDDNGVGWIYTQQTYDWKGRPLVTTNQDGTTKTVSYAGCGCAGGEVTTLTDEGTIAAGGTKKRQQKIYKDVLGRVVKTEILNWDGLGPNGTGGSVYSTTVVQYDARNQATSSTQYNGAAGSGNYQQTSMTYDGFGRLLTSHSPQQQAEPNNSASSDHTTFHYNLDDTLDYVIDARGVIKSFSYNSRHLVSAINYDLSNIPTAYNNVSPTSADVTFSYDAAANRITMTDNTGTTNYHYNALSLIDYETRQFAGPLNGVNYTLSYQYNLRGELKKTTDYTNSTINYDYYKTGALKNVTGEDNLVAQVSTYASDFKYRAWGAVRDVTLGNGAEEHSDFNSRLLLTGFSLNNLAIGLNSSAAITWSYDYYADSRQRHTLGSYDDRFDRLLEYDHVGRLQEAYSGREARGLAAASPLPDSPYRQTYEYNAFDERTQKTGRFWRTAQSGTTPCMPRSVNDGCDGEGNLLYLVDAHRYDAAGNQVHFENWHYTVGNGTSSHPVDSAAIIDQTYDGAGQVAKRVERRRREELVNGGPEFNVAETTTTTYYLYSSVLGGVKVVELDANGNKTTGYVYANGMRLAKQVVQGANSVVWHNTNPGTNSWIETGIERVPQQQEMDPDGAEVGLVDPWIDPIEMPTYVNMKEDPLYIEGGDPFDYVSGYTLDGLPMTTSQLNRILGKMGGSTTVWFDVMGGLRVFDTTNRAWVWPIESFSMELSQKKRSPWKNFRMPPIEIPFNEPEIEKAVLSALANQRCMDFAKTVLGAQKRNGLGTLSDVAKAFFALSAPHFTRNRPLASSLGVSSPTGRISSGTAQIYSLGNDIMLAPQEQMLNDADNAISELFHLAARGDYYTDGDLATAVNNSPYAADAYSLLSDGRPLIDPRSNIFDSRYIPDKNDKNDREHSFSRYFHAIQRKYCTVRPGSESGVGYQP